MKGVILAGGTGSRLFPYTKTTNKHLLMVGNEPMIHHAIHKLKEAGITEILIVTGERHREQVIGELGAGDQFGVNLVYEIQEWAGGVAQALGLARDFAGHEKIAVILGDNIFQDSITPFVLEFKKQTHGAKVLLKEVHDPERYGVAEINDTSILSIEEKPEHPKSHYAVTGLYLYDSTVFEIIDSLTPSGRGELEITDVNNAYINQGCLSYSVLQGFWIDAGTHESLAKAHKFIVSASSVIEEAIIS